MIVHRQIRPELQGNLLVWKAGGVLSALNLGGFDRRNESVLRLLERTERHYSLPDFPVLRIWTEDRPTNPEGSDWRVLSFCGQAGFADVPVPDFLFDGWESVGLGDYEHAATEAAFAGLQPAQRPCLGWIGNCDTSPSRWRLHAMGAEHPDLLDIHHVVWVGGQDSEVMGTAHNNHLSLVDQVKRWGFLIDMEGHGWSARLKLLLHSGRPVFIQARPWYEWFFDQLHPMEHYIPVSNDLGDLLPAVQWAVANPDQAQAIGRAGQAFAQANLTRDDALHRWAQTLTYFAGEPAASFGPPHFRAVVDPMLAAVGAPLPELAPLGATR
jgi:hypothetical protein